MPIRHRIALFSVLILLSMLILPIQAQDQVTHEVQAGENLYRIALKYGVDMNELAQANNIVNLANIHVGQALTIPGLEIPDEEVVVNPLVAGTPVTHVVQRGEVLSRIAEQYGVTVDQILQANNIANPSRILAGQELSIWTTETVDSTVDAPEDVVVAVEPVTDIFSTPVPAVTSNATHIVQRGEHLSQIAQRYGVAWTVIAQANNIADPNRVFAGTELIIPGVAGDSNLNDIPLYTANPTNVGEPGARVGVGRELVVVLSSQMAYAYEDGILKKSALVSTGLPATPTVQGDYSIWHKTPAQTMSGPGYYLENVQWVMYFYQGYGFHGTYWHNNFGNPMSHGCVNMTNADALWFYEFASLGTPVHVRYY